MEQARKHLDEEETAAAAGDETALRQRNWEMQQQLPRQSLWC
jgi:hypothetical protein